MHTLEQTLNISSLGQFKTIELVEIIGIFENSLPFNIFTIAIAQEDEPTTIEKKLTRKLIDIKNQKGLKIGIFKSILPINDFLIRVQSLTSSKWFNSNKQELSCGTLRPLPKVFAPKTDNPKNDYIGLLKNNFWGGSHIFEWFDESKAYTQLLISNHLALEEVSTKIQEILPIKIGSHSDRLGNFIVQIPCMAVTLGRIEKFNKESNHLLVAIHISPHFTSYDDQQLSGIFLREENQNLIDFHKQTITRGKNTIPFQQINGKNQCIIWDETNKIVCAGYTTSGFIENSHIAVNCVETKQRIICLPGEVPTSIQIQTTSNQRQTSPQDYREYKYKRLVLVEKADLKQKMTLLQFYENCRIQALVSIRALICKYGHNGVYIWDPYLSAVDLLETVVFLKYANVPIKALTGLKVPSNNEQDIVSNYRSTLDQSIKEAAFLNLTFIKADKKSPHFHDRFLIFPKSQFFSAQAWFLGTSVNSLGKSHHIIQKVNDAQIIEDAFNNFWNQSICNEENMIWKYPVL